MSSKFFLSFSFIFCKVHATLAINIIFSWKYKKTLKSVVYKVKAHLHFTSMSAFFALGCIFRELTLPSTSKVSYSKAHFNEVKHMSTERGKFGFMSTFSNLWLLWYFLLSVHQKPNNRYEHLQGSTNFITLMLYVDLNLSGCFVNKTINSILIVSLSTDIVNIFLLLQCWMKE